MEAVANLLELIVELLKRNYKKPKLWIGIIGKDVVSTCGEFIERLKEYSI